MPVLLRAIELEGSGGRLRRPEAGRQRIRGRKTLHSQRMPALSQSCALRSIFTSERELINSGLIFPPPLRSGAQGPRSPPSLAGLRLGRALVFGFLLYFASSLVLNGALAHN
jgi:hypothetical protein